MDTYVLAGCWFVLPVVYGRHVTVRKFISVKTPRYYELLCPFAIFT